MKFEFEDIAGDFFEVELIEGSIDINQSMSESLLPISLNPSKARNLARILVIFADELERQK